MKWALFIIASMLIAGSAWAGFALFQVSGTGGSSCWTPDSNGWTTICSTPVTTGTCAAGTANGTCYVAVSTSGNNGTCISSEVAATAQASPCATLSFAQGLMRNLSTDHMQLKKGDTFNGAGQTLAQIKWSGASTANRSVIEAYGTGARPKIQYDPSSGEQGCVGSAVGGGVTSDKGNNIVIVGIECYNYTRDPGNVSFDPSNAANVSGFVFVNPYDSLIIEDCKVSFFVNGLNLDASVVNSFTHNNTRIRRNIIVDNWVPTASHAQGIHATFNFGTFLIEENLFDNNGCLCANQSSVMNPITATVTIASPGVITAAFGFNMYNGAQLSFHNNGDTLPTGLAFNTAYILLNVGISGANTFELSTDGVTPINTSGSQSGTHKITWDVGGGSPAPTIFNHGIYLDAANDPVNFNGNIVANSSELGLQGRPGGTATGNLFAKNPTTAFLAGANSSFTDNVVDGPAGWTCTTACPNENDGLQFVATYNGSMTGNVISNAGNAGQSAITLKDSSDDCGRISFSIANPMVVMYFTGRVFTNQAVSVNATACGGTLPSHLTEATTYFITAPNGPYFNLSCPATPAPANGGLCSWSANWSTTLGGGNISTVGDTQSNNFKPLYYVYQSSTTGNTIYNFGNATGNANISNGGVNSGTNTISPNSNFNSGGGGFTGCSGSPNNCTIGNYNAQISGCAGLPGGCTATLTAFLASARAQSKDNWNTNLTACAVNKYIKTGFGITDTCNVNQ